MTDAPNRPFRILYLVHNVFDAAVRRRIRMLHAGGAEVVLAGFRRTETLEPDVEGIAPIHLGLTKDARMVDRALAVLRSSLVFGRHRNAIGPIDVIIARNLEMLAIGVRARSLFGGDVPVAFECLDIHRLMLSDGLEGKVMRSVENFLARRSALLITSSPAFIENYFERRSELQLPILLMENKVLELAGDPVPGPTGTPGPAPGEPWRIGWFGAIRCHRSLALLSELARQADGAIEVVIRGKPAYTEFDGFDRLVAEAPHVSFGGPYRNPEDLAAIYGDVHFSWAIDFFEAGVNSNWLLPNRLYEGSRHGAVPIAVDSVETGRFLDRLGIGVTLPIELTQSLARFFRELTLERYAALRAGVAAIPAATWVCDETECRMLVDRLRQLAGGAASQRSEELAA